MGHDRIRADYGSWDSPIGAARLAQSATGLADLQVHDGVVYWREGRPDEGGRQVLMSLRGNEPPRQLTPPGFNVRSRAHEYGGVAYLVIADAIVFCHFDDQRLYLQRGTAWPVPITPPGYRYADFSSDRAGTHLLCVREDHTELTLQANGEERNEIVVLDLLAALQQVAESPDSEPTAQAGRVLVSGTDFVAYPRLSADGRRLAWVWWDHPDMPWDGARVSVAELDGDSLADANVVGASVVGGGAEHSASEPQWDADGSLYFIDEPDGWWNLFAWQHGSVRAVSPMQRECGEALWQHGRSTYVLTGDGRALLRSSLAGVDALGLLDLRSGELRPFELPFVAFADVRLRGPGHAVAIAYSATEEAALIEVDLADGSHRQLQQPVQAGLAPDFISRAEPLQFPTRPADDGRARSAHAFFYPPTHPGYVGPEGALPPLLVTVHGGPTAATTPTFSLSRQYWTSRGFAVVDVNYGGSTTFGREYRRRLNGQWGVVDLNDVVAAVEYLVAAGRVDPQRIAIRGGSAGGYLVLAALAFTDRFNAGANYYGVSDIQALSATCHKFERCYDVWLVGPPDEALYRERSPLYHLERFDRPLISFQGADDLIVTADQSQRIFEGLKARGVPSAYIEFPGEQHGFRAAANIIRAQEAELYFYGQVFGFSPADRLPGVEIHNLVRAVEPQSR